MSGQPTKIFGMNLGVDPKWIVLALIAAAALLYYFTSGSDSRSSNTGPATANLPVTKSNVNPTLAARSAAARRSNASKADRAALKLVPVDGSRGDIDPTLRLELLERVKNIPPATGLRNLFEAGIQADKSPLLAHAPIIKPAPIPEPVAPVTTAPPPPPPFVIPLKYYGFVKPNGRATENNRGFFMDGDNILIGAEGDILEKRFLVVALTPNNARLEDTQAKQGQDLPVTPEAPPTQ